LIKPATVQREFKPIPPSTIEWPTVTLIGLNCLAFLALTWFYHALPWWLVLALGGYLIALFGSLQHEVLHGHPTPNQRLNEALVFLNITLWMPYTIYKTTHLTHHINHQLTDPMLDPESYYLLPEKWQQHPNWIKAYYRFYNTLIGRVFCGPLHIVVTLWVSEIKAMLAGDLQTMRTWCVHLFACLPVLYWVMAICNIPLWQYLVLFIYPGLSLTLLRSFVEHQAVEKAQERSIIVETSPLISLMYLNNNLHAVHHSHPNLAWFRLPKVWQNDRDAVLNENGNYYFKGYFSIICQYWRTPKETPCHPLS